MLIGIELPITRKNVVNIDPVQLMKAHDIFLYRTQTSKGEDSSLREQYEICRKEIVERLLELESK